MVRDQQYSQYDYRLSEMEHRYGKNIHVLRDPTLHSWLARICSPGQEQPVFNELIGRIYEGLLHAAIGHCFPRKTSEITTRMVEHHPEGRFESPTIDAQTPTVSVNLARAGTWPSQICYQSLNYLMSPQKVRQDHIVIGRQTDSNGRVTGSKIFSQKIGGGVDGAIVLFPDPMAATGSTLVEAIRLYRGLGKALKYVALHCIITPEYLRTIQDQAPELEVFAVRLDRGLSPSDVLASVPGTHWAREKGLNDHQYIVPGGGGFGEVLNNSYV